MWKWVVSRHRSPGVNRRYFVGDLWVDALGILGAVPTLLGDCEVNFSQFPRCQIKSSFYRFRVGP